MITFLKNHLFGNCPIQVGIFHERRYRHSPPSGEAKQQFSAIFGEQEIFPMRQKSRIGQQDTVEKIKHKQQLPKRFIYCQCLDSIGCVSFLFINGG